jgi:hypothetical protein
MSDIGSNREELSTSICFPLCPQTRTLLNAVGMSQTCQNPKKLASGYPARMLAFIPIPDHLENVGQHHDGGNNVQTAILAERISADGFGCSDLPRLRGRILLPGSGFEIGVATLNGVTTQQLNGNNPAITGYITHLHLATAGFIAATAIAAGGLAWYGVRDGLWWAWITAVISPVLGLAVALPMHWMGHFNYDWVSHLGPIYLGTIIYVVGVVVALIGLSQAAPTVATARR